MVFLDLVSTSPADGTRSLCKLNVHESSPSASFTLVVVLWRLLILLRQSRCSLGRELLKAQHFAFRRGGSSSILLLLLCLWRWQCWAGSAAGSVFNTLTTSALVLLLPAIWWWQLLTRHTAGEAVCSSSPSAAFLKLAIWQQGRCGGAYLGDNSLSRGGPRPLSLPRGDGCSWPFSRQSCCNSSSLCRCLCLCFGIATKKVQVVLIEPLQHCKTIAPGGWNISLCSCSCCKMRHCDHRGLLLAYVMMHIAILIGNEALFLLRPICQKHRHILGANNLCSW
mmetsp:Transcript_55990/g.133415  ORF Transcript_55990/g.133415 Transcript_55990/m.133415 type:complete len:280 (-) Transcript_55990:279-1118(-)